MKRARKLGVLAFFLAITVALTVRLGLSDGNWLLFVPAIASASVIMWPLRAVVLLAIVANAAIVILGLMTVGIFYGFSLAVLILALAAFRATTDQTTA